MASLRAPLVLARDYNLSMWELREAILYGLGTVLLLGLVISGAQWLLARIYGETLK